jgi:enamine deaminase RidA (YjgF/YER057c/UK114 family)
MNPKAIRLAILAMVSLTLSGCSHQDSKQEATAMKGTVQHLNPEGLHRNPAFSQAVAVSGNVKTVYVGGQNAMDASGKIVGQGDIKVQSEQALKNLQTALAAAGATIEHVVKWNVYILQGQSLQPGFEAFRQVWGNRPNPPAVTGLFVAGLAHPDYLVEIEAVAVVPQE